MSEPLSDMVRRVARGPDPRVITEGNARTRNISPIVPRGSISGRALIAVVAIMTFLASITTGAVLLVALVVILFLQTWRASIIPIVAIPVSLVGTFAVLAGLGFSLNTLSLFGLVLAVGIVVDDAIVVVENVERNLAGMGEHERLRTSRQFLQYALEDEFRKMKPTALFINTGRGATVNEAAQMMGGRPLVDNPQARKTTRIAEEELQRGLLEYETTEAMDATEDKDKDGKRRK